MDAPSRTLEPALSEQPTSTSPTGPAGDPGVTAPDRYPGRLSRTWEMELLLSGATVFGVLQVPPWLDGWFYLWFASGSTEVGMMVLPLWIYAKLSLLTLAGTFILHLALRAHWVALIGLDSVFPGGIRLERLEVQGPLRRRLLAGQPSIGQRIERADDAASTVFGVGIGLAMVMLAPFVLVSLALTVLLALELAGMREWKLALALGLLALGLAPGLLANVLDAQVGHRLAPDGRAAALLTRVLKAYDRVGLGGQATNTLLALFSSHVGRRPAALLIGAVFTVGSALVMAQFATDVGQMLVGDYEALPADRSDAPDLVFREHYASLRGHARSPVPVPFIPDRVSKDPYLELFVPYRPSRHGPALQKACPGVIAANRSGEAPRPALDCLARLLDIRLDGRPVGVPLEASTDPVTGVRGVLLMIPATGLSPGRHELTIERIANSRKTGPALKPHRIPFWR